MKTRLLPSCLTTALAVAFIALCGLPAGAARAQSVEADKAGDIFFTDAAGHRTQLTHGGGNSDPSLDPAKHRIVYVHAAADKKKIPAGSGDVDATELCLMDIDGKNSVVLVRSADAKKPENVLADFGAPQFSPDGKTIYFESAAWATSYAVHAYDLTTKKEHFVCAGGSLLVVPAGSEYAGDLLVQQHRYFVGGGSYDWYWLFSKDGKEIGVVGETTDNFREMYFGKH